MSDWKYTENLFESKIVPSVSQINDLMIKIVSQKVHKY
jgi:hypothetical protein